MSTTIFISSTFRDLVDHRAAVATALLNAGFHPIDMANFMARPERATNACLKEVAEADLFVGIYAWRYGFIPEDAEISITEQELIEAKKLGKPCFCFVVDEDYPWPEEYREKGIGARLLRDFKARIDATLVRTTFTAPEDLATKVLASLQRWERENAPKPGRVQTEPAMADSTFNLKGADIKAAVLNQGGVQHIRGPIEVDLSETTARVESSGIYVAGDQVLGDFQRDIVNVRSTLDSVTQNISTRPNSEQTVTEELIRLVNELKHQLERVPPTKVRQAERVSRRVGALLEEVSEDEPDIEIVEKTDKSLQQAAQSLAPVLPDVPSITTKIVAQAAKLIE